jgi:hypothetical protein
MRIQESKIQQACVQWFRYQYPQYEKVLIAIPNGGKREQKTIWTKNGYKTYSPSGKKLKDEGVMPGVADLLLLVENKTKYIWNYNYLAIEMKTDKGVQSDSQKEWKEACETFGGKYIICRNLDEFIIEINNYLG